jgi:hypothetical protein
VATDIVWPKLHTIVLGYLRDQHQSDVIDDVLCDMLAARRALDKPIERLLSGDNVLRVSDRAPTTQSNLAVARDVETVTCARL